MGQPARLKKPRFLLFYSIAIALRSCTCRSPCVNPLDDISKKQDKLACNQGPIKRSYTRSNKALTFSEACTPPLVPFLTKDFFTKFMKVFVKSTQARDQEQLEPQKSSFKARIPETYWDKF